MVGSGSPWSGLDSLVAQPSSTVQDSSLVGPVSHVPFFVPREADSRPGSFLIQVPISFAPGLDGRPTPPAIRPLQRLDF